MPERIETRKLTDVEADVLYRQLAEGLALLRDESEIGSGVPNHARSLFYELAGLLDDSGILSHLEACSDFILDHEAPRFLPAQEELSLDGEEAIVEDLCTAVELAFKRQTAGADKLFTRIAEELYARALMAPLVEHGANMLHHRSFQGLARRARRSKRDLAAPNGAPCVA